MKTTKRIFTILVTLFLILCGNCIYYVFYGQSKSMNKLEKGRELNLYEYASIYSIHTAAWMFGWILSPEAADQCFLMAFSKPSSIHIRHGKYGQSIIFRTLLKQNPIDSFVLDYPTNSITANPNHQFRKELKYALAYDGAVYWPDSRTLDGELRLEVKYDKYHSIYTFGPISIPFYWELFAYIQEHGWLSKCVIIYV